MQSSVEMGWEGGEEFPFGEGDRRNGAAVVVSRV